MSKRNKKNRPLRPEEEKKTFGEGMSFGAS